jgi:hypothetical protein
MTLFGRNRHLSAGIAARLVSAGLLGTATLAAQNFMLNPLTTAGVQENGIRIYNISAFTSYSTIDSRWNTFLQSVAGGQTLSLPHYSTASGVSSSVGYHFGREDGSRSFSMVYSPSYSYATYGQGWSSLTHVLAVNWAVKLRPQWQLSLSASGATGNFNQLLFSPTDVQSLTSLASSAEGMAGAVLTGQSSDPNVSAATAAAAPITPQQRLLYGDRSLSAVLAAGLSYSVSPRFSVGFGATGNRMQHLVDGNAPAGQNYYVVPQTTDASFSTSLSYLLTPRTSLTGSASYGRSMSSLNQSQFTSTQVGLGRKLTEHFFTHFSGGAGVILPVGQGGSTSVHGLQWEGSGGIGYSGAGHSVMISANRSVADFYGLGATATESASLGWGWKKPGWNWSLQAGVGQNKLLGSQISALGLGNNGIRSNVGVYWNVSRRASVALQYAFVSYSGTFPTAVLGPGQHLSFMQHSVRLNIGWGMSPGLNQGGGDVAAP